MLILKINFSVRSRKSNHMEDAKISCDLCGNPAAIFQRYSGKHLCSQHFIQDLERRVVRRISSESMIGSGDRIGIALSGSKDSAALTYLLQKLFGGRHLELIAITIDEGISGYRQQTIQAASKLCSQLGIEHRIVSFEEELGMDLDVMVSKLKSNPCTPCGVFRKYLLNREAKRAGVNKLATAHNLDDEAQTILMNYLRGDIHRLARLSSKSKPGMVPRIKPLKDIPEKEVMLYSILNKLHFSHIECPYAISRNPFRAQLRDWLNQLEDRHPGIKYSILRGFEKLAPALIQIQSGDQLRCCIRCGEPSSGEICSACIYLEKIQGITSP